MRFSLLDRIVELQPGVRIKAVRAVTLGEEYLKDHFPLFPVLPGVLMVEAMTQAAAWLIRSGEDFAHSIVVLKEARNVRYADFVEPGQVLTVTAEIIDSDERDTRLKTQGTVNGRVNVSARLTLTRYNLAEENPDLAGTDALVRNNMRLLFKQLNRPGDSSAAGAAADSAGLTTTTDKTTNPLA
jgi:3-hydroxyacyl-[acyl-carrier-protein] dehydratase